jgi:hypothetical protein
MSLRQWRSQDWVSGWAAEGKTLGRTHCSIATVLAPVLNWHFFKILGWATAHRITHLARPLLSGTLYYRYIA